MIHLVPLPRSQPPANSLGAFLALCGIFLLGSGLLALAARGLGGLHSLPHGLPGEHPHHCVHHHVSHPSHVATDPLLLAGLLWKGKAGRSRTRLFAPRSCALAGLLRTLDASTLSLVLDVYLLAPYVLLDDLRVFHNVLADADLFLGHGALAHDDLFLDHRNHDLVFADLGLRSLALYGHPLHSDLLVPCRHLYAFAVRAHSLTNLELTGLALAGPGSELLLGPLHPKLVLVGQVGAIGHARRLGSLLSVVGLIGAALLS